MCVSIKSIKLKETLQNIGISLAATSWRLQQDLGARGASVSASCELSEGPAERKQLGRWARPRMAYFNPHHAHLFNGKIWKMMIQWWSFLGIGGSPLSVTNGSRKVISYGSCPGDTFRQRPWNAATRDTLNMGIGDPQKSSDISRYHQIYLTKTTKTQLILAEVLGPQGKQHPLSWGSSSSMVWGLGIPELRLCQTNPKMTVAMEQSPW